MFLAILIIITTLTILLTQIIEPLGRTNIQSWYSITQSNLSGYYPNSLQYTVDPRGLTNWFLYDSNGNITNQTIYGRLDRQRRFQATAPPTLYLTRRTTWLPQLPIPVVTIDILNYDSADGFQLDRPAIFKWRSWCVHQSLALLECHHRCDHGQCFANQQFLRPLCQCCSRRMSATNNGSTTGVDFPTQLTRYAGTADISGKYRSSRGHLSHFQSARRSDFRRGCQWSAGGHEFRCNGQVGMAGCLRPKWKRPVA